MACTVNEILAQARAWIGCRESDGSFRVIIETYNSHKPLARGFTMDDKTAWCDCFISACAIKCGAVDIIGTEVGCEKHVEIFKTKGIWIENESITPIPGDIILYDWDDNGVGDNKGYSDHIGFVESVNNGVITTIEGNYNYSVKRRTIPVNARYIRGFARPNYKPVATNIAPVAQTTTPTVKPEPKATYTVKYTVKKGDTLNKIASKKYTTSVKAIAEANNIANVNLIKVGQVLNIPLVEN